jgi:spore maturation protein CgeB
MNIVYSFNKRGFEAAYWDREIRAASGDHARFIPFNHDPYLDPMRYIRAQLLDNLYTAGDPGLRRMYFDLERVLQESNADALVVDTCPPYHPDYLRKLKVYKALRIADGPISAYDRDFAYLHAYDHVLYHSPAYSAELDMPDKLQYVGAKRADFWPLGLFEAMYDSRAGEVDLFPGHRDIDVLFIGALHVNKMPFLAKVKKALGRSFRLYGLAGFKRNVYFNLKYGAPGWVSAVRFEDYVPLYRRAKIGINVHNRGDFTVGGYRLFDLPANGVLQISDGGAHLNAFFKSGEEIVGYRDADDLIEKVRYYLAHADERITIARNGYRRVMANHRIRDRFRELAELIETGAAAAVRSPGTAPLHGDTARAVADRDRTTKL